MEGRNPDTVQGHPSSMTTRSTSKMKQQPAPSEMLGNDHDDIQLTHSDVLVFKFPKLDFGMPTMDKGKLKEALSGQLHLHSKNAVNDTEIDHPNPQELADDSITDYQNHRLAVVAWFVKLLEFLDHKDGHALLMPALNIMDRYITTCVNHGEDLSGVLKNIGNIRAACFSLSLKMHAVFTSVNPKDLILLNKWIYKALFIRTGETSKSRFNVYILSDEQGLKEAEMQIVCKLRGVVFPANAENTIRLLCKYLILEYLSGTGPRSTAPLHFLNQRATAAAAKRFARTTLDIKLLSVKRWKCIAVCCLLGVIEVCVTNCKVRHRLEDSLISLLEQLKPGEFTRKELCAVKQLFARGCVVCRSAFVNIQVHRLLCKISSMSCSKCERKNRKFTV